MDVILLDVLDTAGLPNFQPSCGFCKWTNGKYWHKIRHFGYTSLRTSFISADKVKVNPACDIGQPVSGTGAKRTNVILIPYIHITYHHITLGKLNARNSGSNEFQTSASIAVTCHEARPFIRQKFLSIVSQQYFGRPTRLCPAGCQANILLIQRCPGNVAKYCATFQWCRKLCKVPTMFWMLPAK